MGCIAYFTGGDAGHISMTCFSCLQVGTISTSPAWRVLTQTLRSLLRFSDLTAASLNLYLRSLDEGSGLDGIMLIKVLRLGRVCRQLLYFESLNKTHAHTGG